MAINLTATNAEIIQELNSKKTVVANNGQPTAATINTIKIGDTNYALPSGGGASGDITRNQVFVNDKIVATFNISSVSSKTISSDFKGDYEEVDDHYEDDVYITDDYMYAPNGVPVRFNGTVTVRGVVMTSNFQEVHYWTSPQGTWYRELEARLNNGFLEVHDVRHETGIKDDDPLWLDITFSGALISLKNINYSSIDWGDGTAEINESYAHDANHVYAETGTYVCFIYGATIGQQAFYLCPYISHIVIPDSITSIGSSAFASSNLISATIPNSITTINNNAFDNCSSFDTVYYQGTKAEWDNITINSNNTPIENATKYYFYNGTGSSSSGVTNVSYDTTSKAIQQTINSTTTDVVSSQTIVGDGNVPNYQTNISIIGGLLTNANGRTMTSSWTTLTTTVGGYSAIKILYQNSALTKQQAAEYMKYMCGSEYVPVYNYDFPRNTLFMDTTGKLYKPQFDTTNGLVVFPINFQIANANNVATKLDVFTSDKIVAVLETSSANETASFDFTDTSKKTGKQIIVNWGDGTIDTLAANVNTATHTYATVGTYVCYIYNINDFNYPGSGTSIFYGVRNCLTKIILPEGITCLNYYCFNGCSNVRTIVLPRSLTSIYMTSTSSLTNYIAYYIGSKSEWSLVSVDTVDNRWAPTRQYYLDDGNEVFTNLMGQVLYDSSTFGDILIVAPLSQPLPAVGNCRLNLLFGMGGNVTYLDYLNNPIYVYGGEDGSGNPILYPLLDPIALTKSFKSMNDGGSVLPLTPRDLQNQYKLDNPFGTDAGTTLISINACVYDLEGFKAVILNNQAERPHIVACSLTTDDSTPPNLLLYDIGSDGTEMSTFQNMGLDLTYMNGKLFEGQQYTFLVAGYNSAAENLTLLALDNATNDILPILGQDMESVRLKDVPLFKTTIPDIPQQGEDLTIWGFTGTVMPAMPAIGLSRPVIIITSQKPSSGGGSVLSDVPFYKQVEIDISQMTHVADGTNTYIFSLSPFDITDEDNLLLVGLLTRDYWDGVLNLSVRLYIEATGYSTPEFADIVCSGCNLSAYQVFDPQAPFIGNALTFKFPQDEQAFTLGCSDGKLYMDYSSGVDLLLELPTELGDLLDYAINNSDTASRLKISALITEIPDISSLLGN